MFPKNLLQTPHINLVGFDSVTGLFSLVSKVEGSSNFGHFAGEKFVEMGVEQLRVSMIGTGCNLVVICGVITLVVRGAGRRDVGLLTSSILFWLFWSNGCGAFGTS